MVGRIKIKNWSSQGEQHLLIVDSIYCHQWCRRCRGRCVVSSWLMCWRHCRLCSQSHLHWRTGVESLSLSAPSPPSKRRIKELKKAEEALIVSVVTMVASGDDGLPRRREEEGRADNKLSWPWMQKYKASAMFFSPWGVPNSKFRQRSGTRKWCSHATVSPVGANNFAGVNFVREGVCWNQWGRGSGEIVISSARLPRFGCLIPLGDSRVQPPIFTRAAMVCCHLFLT